MDPILSPINSDFIQPDSGDFEVTFNSRSFHPLLILPKQPPTSPSETQELNISQISPPVLIPPESSDNLRGRPDAVSEADLTSSNFRISERSSVTDISDKNAKLTTNSQPSTQEDTLTKLRQFSFSPVKRLAELSFNTLKTYPSSFDSHKPHSFSTAEARNVPTPDAQSKRGNSSVTQGTQTTCIHGSTQESSADNIDNPLFTFSPQFIDSTPTSPPENPSTNSFEEQRFKFYRNIHVSGRPTKVLSMSSAIKLVKFKGDGTQDVQAWLVIFFQWAKFHDLPDHKIIDAFPFYLEDNAKIWYDALPIANKHDANTIKHLFLDRFKELDNFLDLSVLQMKQNIAESVSDYLSRIIKTASIKNVPEKVLLSVAMNGLRSDIKTFVVTQNPKSMEQLRQTAILAEKSQPPQISTVETYENLLAENKNVKDQLQVATQNAPVNTIQHIAPQTYQARQNLPSAPRNRNCQPVRFRQMRPQQYSNRNAHTFQGMRPSFQPRPPPHRVFRY